jgi:hypothetical protein
MLTAYTTALPPAALPVVGSVLAVAGTSLLYGVLLAGIAVALGVILQGALARPARRRPELRLVDTQAPRHAA